MRRGFTLIEMLVVIAIIGVLAGITIVGYSSVMRDIRIQKARAECAMFVSACKTYHAYTHEWPDAGFQEETVAVLTSPVEMKDMGRPAVLERLKESQTDEMGTVIDPWGSPYVIEFPEHGVLVYSFGPDMDSDMSHYAGDGCVDGVHESLGMPEPWDDVRP